MVQIIQCNVYAMIFCYETHNSTRCLTYKHSISALRLTNTHTHRPLTFSGALLHSWHWSVWPVPFFLLFMITFHLLSKLAFSRDSEIYCFWWHLQSGCERFSHSKSKAGIKTNLDLHNTATMTNRRLQKSHTVDTCI